MKILSTLMTILLLSVSCMAFAEEKAFDESVFEEKKPEKPKKTRGKEIEAEASVEVPAPQLAPQVTPSNLQQLNEVMSAIQMAEAHLRLQTLESKILENKIKTEEMVLGPQRKMMEEAAQSSQAVSRVFPMPGGNPQVVSLLGGNAKPFEATLKFPSGTVYEVVKGSVLENGYTVAAVSDKGVLVEKGGLQMMMPFASGGKTAPWSAQGDEMGSPVPAGPQNMQPLLAR